MTTVQPTYLTAKAALQAAAQEFVGFPEDTPTLEELTKEQPGV